MHASPFKKLLVDENLNVFVRVAGVRNDVELVSINGVPVSTITAHAQEEEPELWREFLNAMLPSILTAADAPLGETAQVSVRETDGTAHDDMTVSCPLDTTVAAKKSLELHYASIISMATTLLGLSNEDVGCLFSALLARASGGAGGGAGMPMPHEMMEGMAQAMGGMGGMPMPPGAGGAQCKQQ
mmetsp:Transcript_19200/g.22031  ORF Transcript_19200/g.22031 Transcript_19200/m.22031 type:complete len:185 (-) Transcript_19200:207-761(-)